MNFLVFLTAIGLTSHAGFIPKNRSFDVLRYKIGVRLDVARDRFENSVAIEFKALGNIRDMELDCEGLDVAKVSLLPNNDPLTFSLDEKRNILKVSFPKALQKGLIQAVRIDYSGKVGAQHEGLFKVLDPNDSKRLPLYFTQFEPLFARRFFPSNDEPYDKATTEVIVEVNDTRYKVLSNGKQLSDEVYKAEDGVSWRKTHWIMDKPHSSYLVNIAVGQFAALSDRSGDVPLNIYVDPAKTKDVAFALDMLKGSMRFFEDFYKVPYPWFGYGMVGIPNFQWGGMENTTLTSMRESALTIEDSSAVLQKYRIATTVTHELAHQWFGDYVTMRWWDDVWLN